MNFSENEHKILKFWKDNKIFDKLRAKNKGNKKWNFLDGPITANNPMGVHHAWGRTYKDMFPRYKAMQGYDQRFQNGFDCQGLWVEVEVEKELGFKNKKDIEIYGIEKFIEKCKERVNKYSKIQTEQSIRLGQWADWDNSYFTMSDANNYAIWHFLRICKEKNLLYKGRDSVPWCPRCGTAISQHEILTEEYKELTHQSIFVKYPVVDNTNTYFLVWTTTPWTLPGNVALAVHPDFDYVKIKDKQGDILIVLKEKAELIEGGEIIETIKGKKLKGIAYKGLFDELSTVKEELGDYTHSVILWDDVTEEEGTGIVHIAPGCGADDFKLSRDLKLPVIDLTQQDSEYRDGFGELSGKFVGGNKVREWIFENLKQKGGVFKIEDYTHRYPTCWRCKSELIFRVVDEWYIKMDGLRDKLKKSTEKIEWFPGFCKDREIDWLNNMHDWLISKKRYWGLALPIFECECGNFEVIGSKEELKEKAVEGWEQFEGKSPHRPFVDKVKIKCSKCDEIISRIKDVGTPWLDAGIVPFSTMSDDNRATDIPYFNNKKEWQEWFPADFVTESFPGQFKNWFYVMLVMSHVLEGKPPFKTLLGHASVVDEQGEEMHKSKGNAIWFDDGVEKIGADVMRWMYLKQNPVNNMRFGFNVGKENERKLLTLWNSYTYFKIYSLDGAKLRTLHPKSKNVLDKWIISKLNALIKEVTENLDGFKPDKASQAIEGMFINDLSLWFIRRSRDRFQDEKEKPQAEQTLYYVLLNVAKLLAPMIPFFAEEIYQGLKIDDMPESVHLCDWPKVIEKSIDKKLETEMYKAREVVTMALAKRTELGIKVRQPLAQLTIKTKVSKELFDLIASEINVKKVVLNAKLKKDIEFDTRLTDELKQEGQKREIIRYIQSLRKKAGLTPQDNNITVHYDGDTDLMSVLEANEAEIKKITKAENLKQNKAKQGEFLQQKEVKINNEPFWLALSK